MTVPRWPNHAAALGRDERPGINGNHGDRRRRDGSGTPGYVATRLLREPDASNRCPPSQTTNPGGWPPSSRGRPPAAAIAAVNQVSVAT